jgi:lysine-specific demethylase/histidyl-hydroxylase NO66
MSLDPERFAGQIWGRLPWLSRAGELPASFADLFSLAAADEVLSRQGLRTPFLRVARDGSTLAPARFTSAGGVGAGVSDQVSDVRLAQLFAEGSSIVLQALHRTHAPVIDFAQALGSDLGHPVQVNAYLTPPQSQGFSAHYDVHDVFVLQIAGEKRWRIHPPVHPHPLRDQPWTDHRDAVEAAALAEPLIDEVLRPGDALYLPRGYLHAATALGETTAHLTVGVHVWTRRHLLEQLLAATGDDEELRTSLPLGVDVTDPQSLRGELEGTLRALSARISRLDAEDVADGLGTQLLAGAKAAPVGPLAQAGAATNVTADDRLRWRPSLRVMLREQGGKLVVRTPDGVLTLPAHAGPVLSRLQAGEVLTVRHLVPGPPQQALDLARTLLRHCLAIPA